MKTPSPIYPLVALGLALMLAMLGALSPPKGARGPALRKGAPPAAAAAPDPAAQ